MIEYACGHPAKVVETYTLGGKTIQRLAPCEHCRREGRGRPVPPVPDTPLLIRNGLGVNPEALEWEDDTWVSDNGAALQYVYLANNKKLYRVVGWDGYWNGNLFTDEEQAEEYQVGYSDSEE